MVTVDTIVLCYVFRMLVSSGGRGRHRRPDPTLADGPAALCVRCCARVSPSRDNDDTMVTMVTMDMIALCYVLRMLVSSRESWPAPAPRPQAHTIRSLRLMRVMVMLRVQRQSSEC